MKELDLKRVDGYLDLDDYFIQRLGRKYKDKSDLQKQGIIKPEPCILQNKFWIIDPVSGYRIALFKEEEYNEQSYAELLSEEIAKTLNIPVAHYDLASFNGTKGVLSYNFIKKGENYASGFNLILDFYEQKLEEDEELSSLYGIRYGKDGIGNAVNKLNNLEDVWFILEDKYKNHPNKEEIVKHIVNDLVDVLIFDILTINSDRHSDNWGIVEDINGDEHLSDVFDNARTLNMNSKLFKGSNGVEISLNPTLRFTVDNSSINKPLEVLDSFLKISSSEYKDLVADKVKRLEENIEFIPTTIEKRTKRAMPEDLKQRFITNMYNHLYQVEEVINRHSKGTKK